MRSSRGVVAAAVAGTLALAACTPSVDPPASPSPTPSATTSSETKIEREQREAYEAAEQAYRTSLRVFDSLLADGGADSAPASISAVATGPYLADIVYFLRSYKKDQERTEGATKVTRLQRRGYEPTELLLVACVDGREVSTLNKSGKVIRRDDFVVADVTARNVNGRWKIYKNDGRDSKACPS